MLNRSRSLRKPAADPRAAGPQPPMGPPTSDQDQRTLSPSRLPVKPGPRTAATASGGSSSMGPPASTVSRQATGAKLASTALRRATSVRTAKEMGGSSDQVKRESARYPPSSSRTAPGAMLPPAGGVTGRTRSRTTTSMGSASGSTHTRTRSTTTTLPSSTALRPTSQHSASSTATATAAAAAAAPKRPRPLSHHPTSTSTSSASTSRALPSHRRAASTSSRTTAPTTITTTSSTQSQAQPPQQQHSQVNRLKPAFTTLQQHYSPAKSSAPKPLTSTFLAPPSPSKLPTNIAISADMLRLQNELLRLHMLHAAQPSTTASYLASAQATLSGRFAELVASHGELASREADAQQRLNTAALRRWCEGRSAGGGGATAGDLGEEKLRVLDGVVSGLWALSEPGGKYARVVRRFERWAERAGDIQHARSGKGGSGSNVLLLEGDEPALVGELGAQWRDECALLLRRLEAWRHDLAHIGHVPPPPGDGRKGESDNAHPSSLERILAGCGALVGGMLEELELMAGIEREAVVGERQWIRSMIDGVGVDDEAAPRAGAIWRAL